jgi:hypothetical protein
MVYIGIIVTVDLALHLMGLFGMLNRSLRDETQKKLAAEVAEAVASSISDEEIADRIMAHLDMLVADRLSGRTRL